MLTSSVNVSSNDYDGFDDLSPLQPLLRHIMPIVPELPHSMALDMLRQKYIDFARRTRILQTNLNIPYQSGVKDYYLQAPEGYSVYSIGGVTKPKAANPWYWYNQGYITYRQEVDFDVIDNNIIRLRNTPSVDSEEGLTVLVVLIPSQSVTQAPTSLTEPFGQAWGAGVVSDALLIPNKPWSSPGLSRVYEQKYERAVLNARALATSNRQVRSANFKPLRIL